MTISLFASLPMWWQRFMHLIETTDDQGPEQHRQSQLLELLLITLAPTSILLTIFLSTLTSINTPFYSDNDFHAVIVASIMLIIPYWLNRYGHYRLAVYIFIAVAFGGIFYIVVPQHGNVAEINFLDYLIIPVLLGSIFLKKRSTFILGMISVMGSLSLPILMPDLITLVDVLPHVAFLAILSMLLIVTVAHRQRIEMMRQAELAENEQRYRTMFDSAVHTVLVHDGQTIHLCNRSAAQTLGLQEPEQLIGKPILEFIHPLDVDIVQARATQRLAGDQIAAQIPTRYEYRVVGVNGVTRWIDSHSTVIGMDGRKLTLVHAIDITEQKAYEQTLRQQNAYFATLHEIALGLLNRHDPDELLGLILARAGELIGTADGFIYTLAEGDENHMMRRVTMGLLGDYEEGKIAPGEGLVGQVWRKGGPLIINDYDQWHGRLVDFPRGVLHGALGVPLKFNEKTRGVIALIHRDVRRQFTAAEANILQRFADMASIALDNAFLYKTLERRNQILETLNRISRVTVSILEIEELLNTVAMLVGMMMDATSVYIADWQPETESTTILAEYLSPQANDRENISDLHKTYHLLHDLGDDGAWLKAVDGYDMTHIDALEADSLEYQHMMAYGAKSTLSVAMRLEGQPIGYLEIWESRYRREFTIGEIELLQSIANQVSIALNKARLYTALRESEQRNRLILNALPDLVFRINRDMIYQDIVVGDHSDLAAPVEEIIGKTFRDFVSPALAKKGEQMVTAALETDEMQVYEYELEVSGGLQHYESRVVKSGTDEALIFVRNITDRQNAQQREMELRLERERVRLLEDFISDASHDLKTPLSNLKSRIYLLRRAKDDAHRERQLEVMDAELLRLERLIEDLLTMAQLDSKSSGATFISININTVVRETVRAHQSIAERKQIDLHFEPAADLPVVWGDLLDIDRMISNLVSNAVNYTSEGAVTVRTSAADKGVVIAVQDSGIGIAEHDLEHIFERFFRADKARSTDRGGTGLGLAIVKKIVTLHHGDITVSSQPGAGSTFRVWLPSMSKLHEALHHT